MYALSVLWARDGVVCECMLLLLLLLLLFLWHCHVQHAVEELCSLVEHTHMFIVAAWYMDCACLLIMCMCGPLRRCCTSST